MSTIVELGFKANTSGLTKANKELSNLTSTGGRTDSQMGELEKSVNSVNGAYGALKVTLGLAGAAMAAMGTAAATRELIAYSDTWKGLSSQIRQVVDTEEDLVSVREKLFQITQDTRSELDTTVRLYTEITRATENLGASQETVLGVTKTLNNLFTAGGKPISEVTGAIRQLNQGFASGVLRGDEFNSVAEGAPRIMDALSVSLSMTRGELREFAATGGITAEIMLEALQDYAEEAQSMADATARTFEQNILAAQNNALAWVGANESINDSLDALGGGIADMSENIDSIVDAGIAFASIIGGSMVLALGKSAAAAVTNTIATQAATKATLTDAIATEAAAKAEVALFAARNNSNLASAAAVAANQRLATATAATAAATTAAAGATTLLGTATKFLLGPWGLLISAVGVAATVFISSKSESDKLKDSLSEQEKVVDDLEKKYKSLSTAQLASNYQAAQKVLIGYDQQRLDLAEKITTLESGSSRGRSALISSLQSQLDAIDAKAKPVEDKLASIQRILEQGIEDLVPDVPDKSGSGDGDSDQISKVTLQYQSQLETLKSLREQIGLTTDEQIIFNAQQQASANDYTEAQTNAILAQAQAYIDAKNEYQTFQEVAEGAEEQAQAYSEWLNNIVGESTTGQLQAVNEEIEKLKSAELAGELSNDVALEKIKELEDRAKELSGAISGADMFDSISDSAKTGLASIQDLSAQGSSEYAKLGVAIQAVTALQAISAVINQATGDPYTAFARMAAMVSAVASLGVSVSGLGGGFSDDSADNQAAQGLNAWGEKSDSISSSIDITADATDKLVSINTNMLVALETLASDISSAVVLSLTDESYDTLTTSVSVDENLFDGLSTGIGGAILDSVNFLTGGIFTGFLTNTIFDKIGDWLGGSSSTTDKGIQIAGGTLGELSTTADVDAYIETKYKTWAFGSSKKRTDYADLDEASAQFALVFDSLADSVYMGAIAIGLSAEEATAAINSFEIETTKISLKGLSAEEQAEEVEAVFSSIFDNLAINVIPYLADFQEVGEGYGEVLARIATEIGITEVLVDQLGVTIGDKLADPEAYITIANNLSTLAGGVEEFATQVSSFVDSFAPDSVKLGIYTDAMKEALTAVGLELPDTTEGFWDLMEGIDGTTEAGQEQISTLLGLTDTADEYYSLLDDTLGDFNDTLETLSESILSTIDDMFGISYESALTSLDDALLLARAGSFDAALDLDLSSVSADESDFATLSEYNVAQAKTGNKLSELAAITGEEKSLAELSYSESVNQTSLLSELKAKILETNSLLTMQNKLQAESLDNLDLINNKTEYAS